MHTCKKTPTKTHAQSNAHIEKEREKQNTGHITKSSKIWNYIFSQLLWCIVHITIYSTLAQQLMHFSKQLAQTAKGSCAKVCDFYKMVVHSSKASFHVN